MAHGRKKGKPVRPPPPVKPVDYQAPTIADGRRRRPAHEDKTHHVGRVIPCSVQYLFDSLDEGKKEYIKSIFRHEFFIDQVLTVWDDGTISTSQFHAINNMLVEWANVCKGGFQFIGFDHDLGTDSHVRAPVFRVDVHCICSCGCAMHSGAPATVNCLLHRHCQGASQAAQKKLCSPATLSLSTA
eukprot:1435777-Rhodomonas_salina.2